ncbi:hypothetical protein [Streptomyces antibioticus]|uniref:hypothetical protein n=1 Tax=Streptomyces antibioticus TaxID=1890 RepID=UPI0033A46534
MTTPPNPPAPLPVYNVGLSHVTLPSQQVQIDRQTECFTEFTLGTDVILNALSTAADPASTDPVGTDTDRSRVTWPSWQARTVPQAHREWKAVFRTRDRTFRGIYYEAPALEESQTLHVGTAAVALPDAMWKMLQNEPCAVLCTGLTGAPSAAEIATALREGMLQAVLVEALFA